MKVLYYCLSLTADAFAWCANKLDARCIALMKKHDPDLWALLVEACSDDDVEVIDRGHPGTAPRE